MPRLRGVGAVLVVLALLATPAGADTAIDRAKTAIEASDYLTARTALNEALATGTNGPDQLVDIYRLTGIVAGALGDAQASADAFTKCLALSPKATLPAGTSPKIAKPFAIAQKYFAKREPLKIKTETAGDPPSVTVVVASDPLSMIVRVRAIVVVDGKPEQTLERPGSERSTIVLPAGKRLDIRVAVLDDKGNRLVELGSTDVPIVIVGPSGGPATGTPKPGPIVKKPDPEQPQTPVKQRPLYLRWWLHGAFAVIFGGAGVYFGIDAVLEKQKLDELNDTSSNHTFDEALAQEKRVRRSMLLANIGFVAGGVFAVSTGVLYLIRPRERVMERRLSITPVVHSEGGGIVLGGHF